MARVTQVLRRETLAAGLAGTARTVQEIRRLITEGGANAKVIARARRIVAGVAPIPALEIKRLFEWVQRATRFTSDPLNVETLTDAGGQLDEVDRQGVTLGDCDDHVILLGSLLEAIGFETEPVVESYRDDGTPSHVALRVRQGAAWMHLDPTARDMPMGMHAGNPTQTYEEKGLNDMTPSSLAAPPWLGAPGVSEELQGQNSNDAWSSVFAGISQVTDWLWRTPIAKSYVTRMQVDTAVDLAKQSGAYNVYKTLYGAPADATIAQILAATNGAPNETEGPKPSEPTGAKETNWPLIVGLGGAAVLALAFMSGGRRR